MVSCKQLNISPTSTPPQTPPQGRALRKQNICLCLTPCLEACDYTQIFLVLFRKEDYFIHPLNPPPAGDKSHLRKFKDIIENIFQLIQV
jgi:hypothetical protein